MYTLHDTGAGRNWFVVEWHHYENLFGARDTFEAILDLDSHEITLQYHTVSESSRTVVGIENQIGSEGVLYVNRQQPAAHRLHDGLAIRFSPGAPPDVAGVKMQPAMLGGGGAPGSVVTYTLTISNTGTMTDTFGLELADGVWPASLWQADFSAPVSQVGPLGSCVAQIIGVRVEIPSLDARLLDSVTVRARSQRDPLVAASSRITTSTERLLQYMPLLLHRPD